MPDRRFLQDRTRKRYSIQRVWEHHHQIKRLLVASNGKFTNQQIADAVGCSAQTVSNVRNDPMVSALVRDLSGKADDEAVDIAQQVKKLAPIAFNVLRRSMENSLVEDDPKVVGQGVRSAISVLDHVHAKKQDGRVLHAHVTYDDILRAKERAVAARRVVETEAEVVKEEEVI